MCFFYIFILKINKYFQYKMNIKNITYNIELYRECYTDSSGINLPDKNIYNDFKEFIIMLHNIKYSIFLELVSKYDKNLLTNSNFICTYMTEKISFENVLYRFCDIHSFSEYSIKKGEICSKYLFRFLKEFNLSSYIKYRRTKELDKIGIICVNLFNRIEKISSLLNLEKM